MLFRQNPALVDAPLSLQLAVNSPPKTSIKTSGATVVMTAIVKVMVLPPGQSPVQLSSMTMVLNTHNYIRYCWIPQSDWLQPSRTPSLLDRAEQQFKCTNSKTTIFSFCRKLSLMQKFP